ncbi:kinase-like protein [Aspergillus minisclerotigenes]|uniref:Kinase-like protein n=1 Tax=Aspergillus minisclerotigenes TaxID=656917 RepID=A0A5N6IUW6_9EURO|nr:kinase-like protein [Aspergillus minisclerotigenes]
MTDEMPKVALPVAGHLNNKDNVAIPVTSSSFMVLTIAAYDEGPKIEVQTLNQLTAHKDIPVPKVLYEWVGHDQRYFILEERVDGQTLEEAWPSLSASQKAHIADEVAEIRNQLKYITSPSIRSVDQGPCFPGLLFFDLEPRGPFHSDIELWNAIALTLHDPPGKQFPLHVLENLKKRFPLCEPYVLTHCDLNVGNIMVKDGKLVGILDWEYAAYYPIWYEYVSASWGLTEMDAEWKALLREHLDAHGDTMEFWTYLYHLRQYPDLDDKARGILEKLSSD